MHQGRQELEIYEDSASLVSRAKLSAPCGEFAVDDRSAHLPHQGQVKVHVVIGRQSQSQDLICLK